MRFSPSRAARALRFLSNLTHTTGEWSGQPIRLREWQKRPLIRLFGCLNDEELRQFRTLWFEVPRKNGKSEIAAGLALFLLCGDNEPGAQIYGAAKDQEQANLVFDVAAQMVRNDAELSQMLTIIDSKKRIVHKASGSYYRAISADEAGAWGFNAHAVIIDELHAWTTPKSRKLYTALTTSFGARRQPLTIIISTAGFDRTSIMWELHSLAERVLAGVDEDPTLLPVIYAAPEDADWYDEVAWKACNPALGDFKKLADMREFARKAKLVPSLENDFRRFHLNQWTQQSVRWLNMMAWRRNRVTELPDLKTAACCFGGLDLGISDDLCAFVREWCFKDGLRFVKAHFWACETAIAKYPHRPWDVWRRGGWITVTPGDIVDFEQVQADVLTLCRETGVREVAYDKSMAAQMALWLQGKGVRMVDTPQGFSLNESLRNLSDLVVEGKLLHDGNPMLDWHCSNAVVKKGTQRGDIRLDKETAQDKIDGVSALANANDRAIRTRLTSVYETRGVEVLR